MTTKLKQHPTAIIDEGAEIGADTVLGPRVHICSRVRIGEHCVLKHNVYVGNDVFIGNRVMIEDNVSVYDTVHLADDVYCGPGVVFTNVLNPRSPIERKHEYRPTLVKRGAVLGANCTIVCGHTIGEYAEIAPGAVVTKDVPAYARVLGVPASKVDG